MAKLVKSEVEAAIGKGIKDMDSLYRKLYRKGKDAKVPTTFAPAVIALMGSDPFAPKVEAKPKKERKPRQPKAEKPPKPPKTTPYRIGTDYQAIVEFALNGGGNGMSIGDFRKALVANGICADEVKAHASLNVVRNPEQFSNRGKTRCANYIKGIERNAEGKLTEAALAFRKTADYGKVSIEVLSLTPTKADRYGKPPKAATATATEAPAPETAAAPQEQNVTSGDSPAAPANGDGGGLPAAIEPQVVEQPAPQDAPAPGEQPVEGNGEQPVEGNGEQPVEGNGEQPVEGNGEQPVEGNGEQPVEGNGEQPVEGNGEQPVEGNGEQPVEATGETTPA